MKPPPQPPLRTGVAGLLVFLSVLAGLFYAAGAAPRAASVPKKKKVPAPAVAQIRGPVPSRQAAPAFRFPRGKGKIAIVLDDWGYSSRHISSLKTIRQPLAISILPGLPHSEDVALAARSGGHEVMLHIPMEPEDAGAPREEATICAGMSKKEVSRRLEKSLSTVPYARGINNHQGSKATADRKLMKLVLEDVKRRGLFFVDSYVTERSICREVARELEIPFARRSVFLDNSASPVSIRKQLTELAAAASREGAAVGIGHDRPATLAVLKELLPALEEAGYDVVPVSELASVPE
ncbi:MAG: divergent polysaccharide deacetylase family protein [Candidatus Omnitrophica bacterium]|nr:divergent polysaccharide deacetylase family protein [Candidatus Omnitrophota bacterium]